MVNYLELPIGDRSPEVFRAVIEIPKDGTNKFEYDKQLHVFKLDRNLHSPVHYPGDYGFIPSTLSDDGDPLDVLVLVPHATFPGCVHEVRPIGLLEMLDQGTQPFRVACTKYGRTDYSKCSIRALWMKKCSPSGKTILAIRTSGTTPTFIPIC